MRAILTYHSIDDSRSPISVSAEEFAAHCRFLHEGAVQVVPLLELMADDGGSTPRVAITFDDAFENFATHAQPLLTEHGLPATLFVVSGRTGLTNAWGDIEQPGIPTLPLLDWDGLGRVAEAGVELGAHTRTHPRLTACSEDALVDELEHPITSLKDRLGVHAKTFAYPYGVHDDATVAAVAQRYACACTTQLATIDRTVTPHAMPRLDMFYFRESGRLEAFGTRRFRAYLSLRRTLRSVRSAVQGS